MIDRDAVVGLERRGLAETDEAVVALERQRRSRGRIEDSVRRRERRLQTRPGVCDPDLHRLRSSPAASNVQNASWSIPVWARAPFNDGAVGAIAHDPDDRRARGGG